MSGFRFDPPVFDDDFVTMKVDVSEYIANELRRVQDAINAGLEELIIPELIEALALRGYIVLPPVKAGDTVTLTGPGWQQYGHPKHPSMSMQGEVSTVTEVIYERQIPIIVRFDVAGESFTAPLRPAAEFAVTITTV